jgi:hypothetical protein
MTITENASADWAWPPTFAFAAVAGSLAAGCMMPFAAVAVIAAGTLDLRRGAIAVLSVWAANQIIGFGLLGYPVDGPTIGSGFALGASTLIAFAVARKLLAGSIPSVAKLALTGALGFIAYEVSLYAMAHLFGGTNMFTAEIIALIGTNEAFWFVGLFIGHQLLTRALPGQFGMPAPLTLA